MIFITVGTHEQPFNRLLKHIDKLKENGTIKEEVIMQTGFSTYAPQHCKWQKFYLLSEMNELMRKARIVITHGGPSSFIMPLQIGKIPIVVPRQKKYDEHVNNHQIEFCRKVANIQENIIEVEDMEYLDEVLENYNFIIADMKTSQNSNNEHFCKELKKLIDTMIFD